MELTPNEYYVPQFRKQCKLHVEKLSWTQLDLFSLLSINDIENVCKAITEIWSTLPSIWDNKLELLFLD
jgi:hypothetical protein